MSNVELEPYSHWSLNFRRSSRFQRTQKRRTTKKEEAKVNDVKVYAAVSEKSSDAFPNASKWHDCVASHLDKTFLGKAVGVSIGGSAAAPAQAVGPAADDDNDMNLFGVETEEEKKAAEEREAAKKDTKKPKEKYLSDFLDSVDPDLRCDIGTIKPGHYGLLDPNVKLQILRELVNPIAEKVLFKGEVDELLEQRHALGAPRREEALAEAKQKRKEKEWSKAGEEGDVVLANSKLGKKRNSPQMVESSEDSKMKESTEGEVKMENGYCRKPSKIREKVQTTGTGGFEAMGGFLLRILIAKNGATIPPRKRYHHQATWFNSLFDHLIA